jgi:hypothetical protein
MFIRSLNPWHPVYLAIMTLQVRNFVQSVEHLYNQKVVLRVKPIHPVYAPVVMAL